MNFFLAVLSGVTTFVLILIASGLIWKIVIPWYQKITYKGVELKGKWISEYKSENDYQASYTMSLEQNAHSLSGEITIIKKRQNMTTEVSNLSLVGKVWEGFVTLNIISKDKSRLSFAASLYKVCEGGQTLDGIHLYRSLTNDEIKSIHLNWSRTNYSQDFTKDD